MKPTDEEIYEQARLFEEYQGTVSTAFAFQEGAKWCRSKKTNFAQFANEECWIYQGGGGMITIETWKKILIDDIEIALEEFEEATGKQVVGILFQRLSTGLELSHKEFEYSVSVEVKE